MRILISGASGLIGTALSAALRARDDVVIPLVRPASPRPGTDGVAWDPSAGTIDAEGLEAQGPIDAIVNLAGAGIADKRWSNARRIEILESRVNATALLARTAAAMASPPSAFVSGSAIGVYGNRGDEILDDDAEPGTGFLADVCLKWEGAALPAVDAGIRTTLARTGIVLSSAGGALAKQLPLFRAGLGGKLADGSQWFSWIGIDDEVGALLAMIDDESLTGPINLTAPEPVTNGDFTMALGKALHRPTILRVPSLALKTLLGTELTDEALLASQRVVPTALLASGFSFGTPTVAAALDGLVGPSA